MISSSSKHFTEIWFRADSTEKINIYYNRFLFSGKDRPEEVCHTSFQLNNGSIKKLNYRNVNQYFSTLNYSNRSFQRARQFRFLQYVSVAVATGLLATIVHDMWPSHGDRTLKKKHINLFLASGCLVAFSLYLEIPKERKLVKALKGYR